MRCAKIFVGIAFALTLAGCGNWKELESDNKSLKIEISTLKADLKKANDLLSAKTTMPKTCDSRADRGTNGFAFEKNEEAAQKMCSAYYSVAKSQAKEECESESYIISLEPYQERPPTDEENEDCVTKALSVADTPIESSVQ